jgi:hypothetical protein
MPSPSRVYACFRLRIHEEVICQILSSRTRRNARGVRKVRQSLARVQVSEGGFGGSFWYLFPDSIETHDGVFALTHEVTATVANEVKRQFAPAKMLALGIFGATKKKGRDLHNR